MNSGQKDDGWDPNHLQRRLQAMDDYEFEHLVGDLWEVQGWNAEVEQQSADAGVDVRATQTTPYRRKVLIQAKRYSDDNPVSGPDVQQYAALKQQEPDTDESIIVTTGRFTGSAEDRAEDLNVKLIDGEGLVELIDSFSAYEIVEDYIGQPKGSKRQDQVHDQDSNKRRVTRGDTFHQLTPEEQTEIENVVGQDLDEYIRDEQYRATRAMERAQGTIELNPHDAKELGIFDETPLYDFERKFNDKKTQLIFLKDDIHINDNGEVYVEDLTDYINPTAIEGSESNGTIGIIKRGVKDGAWLTDEKKEYWEAEKQLRRFKKKGKNLLSSLTDDKQKSSDSHWNQTPTTTSPFEIAGLLSQLKKGLLPSERGDEDQTSTSQLPETEETVPQLENSESALSSDESVNMNSHIEETPRDETVTVQQARRHELSSEQGSGIQAEPSGLDLSRSNWFYGVAAGTGGWALIWLLTTLLPDATSFLIGITALISWPLLPAAMLIDTWKTGKFKATKTKSLIYVVFSIIPLLAVVPGAVYLYRRENAWER